MEIHVHRLFTELISGRGTELNVHPELDKAVLPEAQYKQVFSEDNTAIYFEHELVDIERPPAKDIFIIGSMMTDEHVFSYSMPYNIDSKSGSDWDRRGHSCAVRMESVVRVSMITGDKVQKQAYAKLHYMQLFAQQALRNPPTQDWWSRVATLVSFTAIQALPQINMMGFEEPDIYGRWFGARFHEVFLPDEHVALRRL